MNIYFWNKNEKNASNRLEPERRSWFEKQMLVHIILTGNARILHMPESAEKYVRIVLDKCNFDNMSEFA